MINANRLGRPPVIRTGAKVLSDGRWRKAPKHVLDGIAPLAVLSPASGRSMLNGRAVNDNALVSRQGGIKYVFDANGVLVQAPVNALAYDWSSGVRELLFEGQATNMVPNSAMAGFVTGTPGSMPYWSSPGTYYGLSRSVVGIGTKDGMSYVDVRISGTTNPDAPALDYAIDPMAPNVMSAAPGNAYVASIFVALVAGTLPAAAVNLGAVARDSTGLALNPQTRTNVKGMTSKLSRFSAVLTCPATTVYAQATFRFSMTANEAVDFTVRLACPQLEKATAPSSPIMTSGSTVTRPADICPLWADAGQATAWAWRGYVPAVLPGNAQVLLHSTGGSYIASGAADPSILRFAGSTTVMAGNSGVIPGPVGACGGWGVSGRTMANTGFVAQQDANAVTYSREQMGIGIRTGMQAGQVIRLRELIAWQLPDRPSATGCQSQARQWSA